METSVVASFTRYACVRIEGEERYRCLVKYVVKGLKVRYNSVIVVVKKIRKS